MKRIGLIGCGRWGRLILRDLRELDAAVHVAVPSEAGRRRALELGAVDAYACAEALDEKVEAFVVATPTVTHAQVIEGLVATGKPIFVEKPMTCDVASARRLAAQAAGRLFVMDKWRHHPGVQALADMVKGGELGDILAIRSYRLGWGNPHRDVDAWWILLPHDLAITYHLLGVLPPAREAMLPTPGRADADAIVVLGEEGGPRITIEIASTHPSSRRATVVQGTRASAELADSYDEHVLHGPWGRGLELPPPSRSPAAGEMPLKAELRAFLGFLDGGPPPMSSAAEGLMVVERIAELRALAGLV